MTIENSTPDLADGKPKKASKLTVAIAVIFSVLNILIAPAVVGARFNPQRMGRIFRDTDRPDHPGSTGGSNIPVGQEIQK